MKHSGLHWKGYFAVGEELTSGKPDNKEGLYFGEEYSIESEPVLKKWAMHGPNQFPEPSDVEDSSFTLHGCINKFGTSHYECDCFVPRTACGLFRKKVL